MKAQESTALLPRSKTSPQKKEKKRQEPSMNSPEVRHRYSCLRHSQLVLELLFSRATQGDAMKNFAFQFILWDTVRIAATRDCDLEEAMVVRQSRSTTKQVTSLLGLS